MATTKANTEKGPVASKLIQGAQLLHRVRNKIRGPIPIFKLLNRNKARFECPICGYDGPFADFRSIGGFRKHAVCPQCGALERHRLQYLVMRDIMSTLPSAKMLHFAPEQFFRPIFSKQFREYETADLFMEDVDHRVDIRNLPFPDGSYDLVFASHVLEHITDDLQAVKEIRRVLRPGGIAVLPVPIVSERTIEYPGPNPHEAGHVRAPGTDYFEKYLRCFKRVDTRSSNFFPEKYQLFIYEDRMQWPTKECPLRPPMQGEKHSDFVPICYV